MSRAAKIFKATILSYSLQLLMLLSGILMTPFLIRHLGSELYSNWLIIGQVLMYLGLLDFGVLSLLPREIAIASGKPDARTLQYTILHQAKRILLWQWPIVILATAASWLYINDAKPQLSLTFGWIAIGFPILFLARVPGAVLQGLQHQKFLMVTQLFGWAIGIISTIILVKQNYGLTSLAISWVISQFIQAGLCYEKLRQEKFEESLVNSDQIYFTKAASFWTTTRQIAHLLLNGTDLILVAILLGNTEVIIFSCTFKLIQVGMQFPYQIAHLAMPALSELRGIGNQDRLLLANRALNLSLLLCSGTIAFVVYAINQIFVTRWVGPEFYGTNLLTLLLLINMQLRHLIFGWSILLFSMGHDRDLALLAVADGLLYLLLMYLLIPVVGMIAVPIAGIVSVAFTQGCFFIRIISRSNQSLVYNLVIDAIKFSLGLTPLFSLVYFSQIQESLNVMAILLPTLLCYTVFVLWQIRYTPLKNYIPMVLSRTKSL